MSTVAQSRLFCNFLKMVCEVVVFIEVLKLLAYRNCLGSYAFIQAGEGSLSLDESVKAQSCEISHKILFVACVKGLTAPNPSRLAARPLALAAVHR